MFLLKDIPDKKTVRQTAKEDISIDASSVCSALLMLKASSEMLVEIDKFFALKDLSLSRFTALSVLSSNPDGLFPYELADHMGISRATVSSILKGLETSGYVETAKSGDDGRMKKITPTSEGVELHNEMVCRFYALLTELFGVHDKKDMKAVGIVMKAVTDQVQNYKLKG